MRREERLGLVRRAVRSVLENSRELDEQPVLRRHLAERMVAVSMAAVDLAHEQVQLDRDIAERSAKRGAALVEEPPLASAQAAADMRSGRAVQRAPDALLRAREAIDFPGFVTSLVTGVFQAMTTSTTQQLESYMTLLEAVDASIGEFADEHISSARAREWAAARFPELTLAAPAQGESKLELGPDGELPDPAVLRAALGATQEEVDTVDSGDLEETLIPIVRRKLATDRQAMLATMVMMGMQRVVVDDGRIHASMKLRVDTRSVAEQAEASQLDTRVSTAASGSFGMGMWGASASLSATVGYVESDEQFSREDIALQAGLRSSVDIAFRTDQIPLDRFAQRGKIERIQARQVVPDSGSLLGKSPRNTSTPNLPTPEKLLKAPSPDSKESEDLRRKRDRGQDIATKKPAGKKEGAANKSSKAGPGSKAKKPTSKTGASAKDSKKKTPTTKTAEAKS